MICNMVLKNQRWKLIKALEVREAELAIDDEKLFTKPATVAL